MRWLGSAVLAAGMVAAGAAPTGAVAGPRTARPVVTCDGTWHIVKTPVKKTHATRFYGAAAVSATDAWAVGSDNPHPTSRYELPRAEHWDGTAWSVVKTPLPKGAIGGSLQGVSVVSNSDVWAVGWYKDFNGINSALIEHWDGSAWKLVSSGLLGTDVVANGIDAIAAGDIWLVGYKGFGSGTTFTAHWNGSTWKVVPSPNQNGSVQDFLYSVSGTSGTDAWAVGAWTDTGWAYGLVEHWDGSAWKIVKSKPAFSLTGSAAVSGNDAWAVGIDASGSSMVTQRWNGSKWSTVAPPSSQDPTVGGVSAAASDDVWLAGTTFGISVRTVLTAHWDGNAWAVVPSETPTTEVAIEMTGVSVTSNGATAFAVGTYWISEFANPRTLAEIWC